MLLEATITYEHYVTPTEHRDLADFFPRTREFFSGYIRTEVFRSNIADAMHGAKVAANQYLDSIDNTSHLHPLLRDEMYEQQARQAKEREYAPKLKENLLNEVERITWIRWQPERDLAAEMRQQAKDYFAAASHGVVEKALDKVGGRVAKQVKKVGGQQLGKMIGQGKINEKLGKTLGKHGLGSHKIVDYKLKPKGFTNNLIEVDIDVNLPDKVVGDTLGTVSDTIPTGIEVGLDNDVTRGLLKHAGMSDEWAGRVMGTADFLSGFSPHVVFANVFVGTLVNAGVGLQYCHEAAKIEKWQKENEEKWNDFNRQIRSSIVKDISAMTDTTVVELQKFLENQ